MKGEYGYEDADVLRDCLKNESYDWYVVEYDDGSYDVAPASSLSAILECGYAKEDYAIEEMYQCWNGEELGDCPF